MPYVFRTLVVPTAQQAQAQSLCSQLAGPPGSGMFTTALSATGNAPATHYVSTGMVESQFSGALSDPAVMFAACSAAGVSVTLQQCTALLSASDVSAQQPMVALARMGLQMIQGS